MTTVAVVGLGYVGLPLAVEFGKRYRTIGFDLSEAKVAAYRRHIDPTGEVSTEDLKAARLLEPTNDPRKRSRLQQRTIPTCRSMRDLPISRGTRGRCFSWRDREEC